MWYVAIFKRYKTHSILRVVLPDNVTYPTPELIAIYKKNGFMYQQTLIIKGKE